jgi:hypothetical protein
MNSYSERHYKALKLIEMFPDVTRKVRTRFIPMRYHGPDSIEFTKSFWLRFTIVNVSLIVGIIVVLWAASKGIID